MAGTAYPRVDHEAFGLRLAALRGERSQAEMARAVGVTQPAWSNYEQGRLPRIDVAVRICREFGVTLDQLFGEVAS